MIASHHISYFELLEAFRQPGCPLCRLTKQTAQRHLDTILREGVNDVEIRRTLHHAQGLCNQHAWEMSRKKDGLGVAIIYRDLLGSVLKNLENATYESASPLSLAKVGAALRPSRSGSPDSGWRARLSPRARCPACRLAAKSEKLYAETLLQHLSEEPFVSAYRASFGLCVPHLRSTLAAVRNETAFRTLLSVQKATWERLSAELSEFIRKHDYRFSKEGFGAEGDSWLRAIEAIIGAEGLREGS